VPLSVVGKAKRQSTRGQIVAQKLSLDFDGHNRVCSIAPLPHHLGEAFLRADPDITLG
jgi:hypothetical protein